jgi:hypothetical protein
MISSARRIALQLSPRRHGEERLVATRPSRNASTSANIGNTAVYNSTGSSSAYAIHLRFASTRQWLLTLRANGCKIDTPDDFGMPA